MLAGVALLALLAWCGYLHFEQVKIKRAIGAELAAGVAQVDREIAALGAAIEEHEAVRRRYLGGT